MPTPADLLPQVYDELRKLAAAKMADERSDHTLDATALVHEAFLKLGGERSFATMRPSHALRSSNRVPPTWSNSATLPV